MRVLGTVNGIGDFGASVIVGLLWTAMSPVAAFGFAALAMLAGAVVLVSVRRQQGTATVPNFATDFRPARDFAGVMAGHRLFLIGCSSCAIHLRRDQRS
jgi:hypothetical protein